MKFLCIAAVVSATGCAGIGSPGIDFCSVEQARRYTAAELDARKPFRRNLERDLVTNQTGAQYCGWKS